MIRPASLLAITLLAAACAAPAPSPTPSPTPAVVGEITLASATRDLLARFGTNPVLGPNAADPEDPEALTIFAFTDEWEFDPATDRYAWGRSVEGYIGAGATVERLDAGRFAERVLGGAARCDTLVAENLEIAALADVAPATVLGHPGKIFTEAYGDGAILAACADLDGGASLLVRVPDPFFITTAAGISTPAAAELRAMLLHAEDPFSD